MSSVVGTVLRHEARTLIRDRGVLSVGISMLVITESILRLTGSGPRALITLLNVVLLIVPLTTIMLGVISWHASREFNELLLAQPVGRRALFTGLYIARVLPLALAFSLGLLVPFVVHRAITPDAVGLLLGMLGAVVALTFTFGGLALLIGVLIEDRLRSVAVALATWLLLTVAYDGFVLLVATTFADYPLERPMLGLMLFNPVDLARTMIVLQSDTAALMGYTGAVVHRFLDSMQGTIASATGLLLWILIPIWAARRAFERRDF